LNLNSEKFNSTPAPQLQASLLPSAAEAFVAFDSDSLVAAEEQLAALKQRYQRSYVRIKREITYQRDMKSITYYLELLKSIREVMKESHNDNYHDI
jgi:hypothetical protein